MWRGDRKLKGGIREKKGENEEMIVYLNSEGGGLSCFEEEL